MSKNITIDYDQTFLHCEKLIKHYQSEGYEIYILTRRFDELNKSRYPGNPENTDMYKVLDDFGISRDKIIFTNAELKGRYLSYADVHLHVDDSLEELQSIFRYAPHVIPILCDNDGDFYLYNGDNGIHNKFSFK